MHFFDHPVGDHKILPRYFWILIDSKENGTPLSKERSIIIC